MRIFGLLITLIVISFAYGQRSQRPRQDGQGQSVSSSSSLPLAGLGSGGNTPKGNDTSSRFFLGNMFQEFQKPTDIASAILGGNRELIGQTFKTLFTTVDSCIGSRKQGWSDPELGDFTIGKDSPYCNSKCYRSYFCCPPQKPAEIKVKFLFSAMVNGRPRISTICIDGCPDMPAIMDMVQRSNNRIVWYVHGLVNDIYVEPIFNQTRDALLSRGYYVVQVDWHLGNRLYLQSMANVRVVGALLGQLMNYMGVEDRSTCAGFSLGSPTCNEAANFIKRKGKMISKCEGIDPAGPGFDGCSNEIRLDRRDCKVVVIMHTSAFKNAGSLLFGQGLGTTLKSGHCDFWVNEGYDQPKCDNGTVPKLQSDLFKGMFGKFTKDLEWAWYCSHYRAAYYYMFKSRRTCNYQGQEAASCGGGKKCTGLVGERQELRQQGSPNATRDSRIQTRGKRSLTPPEFEWGEVMEMMDEPEGWEPQPQSHREERSADADYESNPSDGSSRARPYEGDGYGRDRPTHGYGDYDRPSGGGGGGRGHGAGHRPGSQFGGLDSGMVHGGYGNSGGGRRPGGGFESGEESSGRPYHRPSWGQGGSRPGGDYGLGGETGSRPYDTPVHGSHRPGSGGHNRPGWGSDIGQGSSEMGHGSGGGRRPGSQFGGTGSDAGMGQGGYGRPGMFGNGGSSGRPEAGYGSGEETGGRPHHRPNGNRPAGSASRPGFGIGLGGGQGDSEMADGVGGSRMAPIMMSVMPDDSCNPNYDVDYLMKTTAYEPFC